MATVDSNERTEPVAENDSATAEKTGERNTETHPTLTQNGNDYHVPSTGKKQNYSTSHKIGSSYSFKTLRPYNLRGMVCVSWTPENASDPKTYSSCAKFIIRNSNSNTHTLLWKLAIQFWNTLGHLAHVKSFYLSIENRVENDENQLETPLGPEMFSGVLTNARWKPCCAYKFSGFSIKAPLGF